jgi:hypothetical protein
MDTIPTSQSNTSPLTQTLDSQDFWTELGKFLSSTALFSLSCTSTQFYSFIWEIVIPSCPHGMVFSYFDNTVLLKYLSKVPNLQNLKLLSLANQDVTPLQNLTKLSSLQLPWGWELTQVEEELVSELTGLTSLSSPSVSPKTISKMTRLTKLFLSGFNEEHAAVVNVNRLQALMLNHSHTKLEDFTVLSSFTNLTQLRVLLNSVSVDPLTLGLLTNLERLEVDSLPQDHLNFTKLRILNCTDFVTGESLIPILSTFTNLEKLKLPFEYHVDDADEVWMFTNLEKLTMLGAYEENFMDSGGESYIQILTEIVPKWTNLRKLRLLPEGYQAVRQEYLELFKKLTTALKAFDMGGCNDYCCLEFLNLEKLRLAGDGGEVSDMKYLSHLTNLSVLELEVDDPIPDTQCEYLRGLTNIKNITLTCESMDKQLKWLTFMTQLTILDLFGSDVTQEGLELIANCFTGLRILDLQQSKILKDQDPSTLTMLSRLELLGGKSIAG